MVQSLYKNWLLFSNNMRNLDNFRKAVESSKSWNLMGYICPKNTFLQLKHYIQRIYFQLLAWKFTKLIVIFETISHFSRHNSSVAHHDAIFRLSTARVKVHRILHVIFQTKGPFFFKGWIFFQRHERSFFCTFSAETLYAIDKSRSLNSNFQTCHCSH